MIEQDTIKLLRECDAGIKMGVSSIDEVLDYVSNKDLREALKQCKEKHQRLQEEVEELLHQYQDQGKEPNPMAKSMSWIKTNVKLIVDESDATIADLITQGCNMGVKSLNKYLNQYQAADEKTKDITKKLIKQEEDLTHSIRQFL
jgi:gas vesicle protein